jgi:hypothetical protein
MVFDAEPDLIWVWQVVSFGEHWKIALAVAGGVNAQKSSIACSKLALCKH